MLDWKAASSFYNEEFALETFIKDRSKDAYVVIDMRQIHKASWKYGFDLEGKPFNSNLFMFHRCYSSLFVHNMLGIGSGRGIVFSPEEAFYCEKPCEVEFLADSGQRGGICRFVFYQGTRIKKLEYE